MNTAASRASSQATAGQNHQLPLGRLPRFSCGADRTTQEYLWTMNSCEMLPLCSLQSQF
jgi:hypothetical protein